MKTAFDICDAIVPHLGVLPEDERRMYLELLAESLGVSFPRPTGNAPPAADAGERRARTVCRGKCPQPKVNPDTVC